MASSASMALAALLQDHPDMLTTVAETLFDAYKEKLKVPEVVKDDIGRVISLPFIDPWQSRCGIAVALEKMSPQLRNKEVDKVFSFFVQNGLADRVEKVRQQMLHASMSALNIHGKENIHNLLPVFENFLETAPNTPEVDPVRQSVVILIGSLARYLDQDDPKVKPIVDKLIKALDTPSQQVQETVANCLPPLIPAVRDSAAELVAQLMEKLLEGSQFGERKGAAYGLAGVVKGLGVSSLTQLGIAEKLQETVTNKKNYKHREGALFVFETLSSMLGRLYEPHVIKVIPNLLVCFGDGNQYVREAASDTARAMMAQMSGHGVKRILPSLMSALDDESWRTKTGSVELLGKMAYCAPQQLSACLPSIVPRLMEVLTDSHAKVQHAGTEALKQIGSVIRNPEIQALVPLLLEAMSDIAGKSQNCLQMLLQTQFVHTVDAASLALIMPIVERSLEQRSTETKRMACQLLGDMYTLTTAKDLEPYVPAIMPGLKAALVDPVPEVRSVTARALGSMVKAMGGDSFDDIVPWLLGTIQSEQSNVDRSGGAQGLCEVLLAQGPEKLEEMMPAFIYASQNSDHPAHVRDGYLTLFVHLPGAFGDRFIEYVADIIPPILKVASNIR
jgi:HEAT repeat protein